MKSRLRPTTLCKPTRDRAHLRNRVILHDSSWRSIMQVPLQIKFRHMEPSAIIEARIRERCHKLQRFAEHVSRCQITVDAPHKHQAGLYRVIIDITLPGGQIIASHHSDQHHAHENVHVAVRDAFDSARRQLEDYARRRRSSMRMQDSELHSKIA